MPYFLLIIGFSLLFYYIKISKKVTEHKVTNINNSKEKIDKTTDIIKESVPFNKIFNTEEDLLKIKNELKELKDNINYLNENYIALLESIESITKIKSDDTALSFNDSVIETTKEDLTIDKQIEEMIKEGYTTDEISSKLRIGKGEVLLRIGLKRPKK